LETANLSGGFHDRQKKIRRLRADGDLAPGGVVADILVTVADGRLRSTDVSSHYVPYCGRHHPGRRVRRGRMPIASKATQRA